MKLYIPTRNHLAFLLETLGLNGIGIEIGTHQGEYAKKIISHWSQGTLHLVDPWTKLNDYHDEINDLDRNEDYAICMENLHEWVEKKRIVIKRGTSQEVVDDYPDDYFDFIYIDANHDQLHVYQDMTLWYPKLKVRGVFAGHDYVEGCHWIDVIPAVTRFFSEREIEYSVTLEEFPSWWCIK